MKKGRYQKAYQNFCRIRTSELIAARELYFAHCQILAEGAAFEGKSLLTRAIELFTVPRIRRASAASAWIVIRSVSMLHPFVSETLEHYRKTWADLHPFEYPASNFLELIS